MKLLMIIAAAVASAGLVLPTVTQGQAGEVGKQVASAAAVATPTLRA
ncbi:hypothetical protein GCM10023264_06220 [Sphingomonas daechungensis]|uniref:Uncharacterized protein n=1 Tax=Sphingomonas daechungensis TaxID=1176646 RepID=A0ABX6SZF6_9SPHN|nr:hypothetical protein [Sphingomonas daechungensis]QNP42966.1 hypothetical protein H9L15_13330 [Sphingomonas daechungensis]